MKTRHKLFAIALAAAVAAGVALWLFRAGPHDSPREAPLARTPVDADMPAETLAAAPSELAATIPSAPASPPTAPQAGSMPAKPLADVVVAPAPATPDVVAEDVAEDPPPVAPSEVLTATANMYAAHASLREPEVADPDSETNKEILQTMVLKAIAQPPSPPPGTNSQP